MNLVVFFPPWNHFSTTITVWTEEENGRRCSCWACYFVRERFDVPMNEQLTLTRQEVERGSNSSNRERTKHGESFCLVVFVILFFRVEYRF